MLDPIDYRPLEQGGALVPVRRATITRGWALALVGGMVAGAFLALASLILVLRALLDRDAAAPLAPAIGAVAGLALVIVLPIAYSVWRRRTTELVPGLGEALPVFAQRNGLVYETDVLPDVPPALLAGMWGMREPVVRADRLRDPQGAFEVGELLAANVAAADDPRRAYTAARLPRRLPRISLVPRGTDPGFDVDPAQRLVLEGDFSDRFDLYCPAGYERDALAVLTPDVMAAMLDEAGDWRAELGDDRVLVVQDGGRLATADDYRRAFGVVAALAPEFAHQAGHYSDARVGRRTLDRVAAAGRSLRPGRRAGLVAGLLLLVAVLTAGPVLLAVALLG